MEIYFQCAYLWTYCIAEFLVFNKGVQEPSVFDARCLNLLQETIQGQFIVLQGKRQSYNLYQFISQQLK